MDAPASSLTDLRSIGSLNEHERQILALFAEHRSNQEIADTLFLSLNTVKWYARQIYGKLGVANRREAVARAEQLGLRGVLATIRCGTIHNLPAQLTPFIGRQAEIVALRQMLLDPDCRLLTITGPGGMGKTRLALAVASQLVQEPETPFSHGVFLVSLVDLEDPESIAVAVADAVDLRFSSSRKRPTQQLVDYLQSKMMLLVLDNFEHLLDEEALSFVFELLSAVPGIKMLVTSRVRLNIRGEKSFPLFGLDVPQRYTLLECTSGDLDVVNLFVDVARRANPVFTLDLATCSHVVSICRLVEGMPLAIELAAAWTAVLEPIQILAEIRDSLDFLSSDAVDIPFRHRSLPTVFDTSWNMLNAAERDAMQGLSVFRSGFTCDAARAVTGVSPQALRGLLRKSWVQRTATGRYQTHALLRQYAAEKLAQDKALQRTLRNRHSLHFCTWLAASESDLLGLNHVARMKAIHADVENIHAACFWAAKHAYYRELDRAIESLGLYYRRESYYIAGDHLLRQLTRTLSGVTDQNGLHALAQILTWRCYFSAMLGDAQTCFDLADQALELLHSPSLAGRDTRDLKAKIYLHLAFTTEVYTTNVAKAERYFRRSFSLFDQIDDKIGMALASLSYGRFLRTCKRISEAEAMFRLAIRLLEDAGSQAGYSDALGALGTLAYLNRQFNEAESLLTESLSMATLDDHDAEATALFWLARTYYEAGNLKQAVFTMGKCLDWRRKQGMQKFIVSTAVHHAMMNRDIGAHEQAKCLALEALEQSREHDYHLWEGSALGILGSVSFLAGDTHAAYGYLGRSVKMQLPSESVLIYTGRHAWFGFVLRALGQSQEAWRYSRLGLQRSLEARCYLTLLISLSCVSQLLVDVGQVEQALEVHALLLQHPYIAHVHWFSEIVTPHITTAAVVLSKEQRSAVEERGRAQDLWEMAAQLVKDFAEQNELGRPLSHPLWDTVTQG